MNTNVENRIVEIPLPVLKRLKQNAFIANMVAVAKEFNLCVSWRKEDKNSLALKLPWR